MGDAPTSRDVVPVFPLPGTVFFPGTSVPLHVFEPRYRMLVRDTTAGSGLIDAGIDVGLPFNGLAPDLGYAEFSGTAAIAGAAAKTPLQWDSRLCPTSNCQCYYRRSDLRIGRCFPYWSPKRHPPCRNRYRS